MMSPPEGLFFVVGIVFGGFAVWASTTGRLVRAREFPVRIWARLAAWSYARLAARKHFEQVHASIRKELQGSILNSAIQQEEIRRYFHQLLEAGEAE